MQQEQDFIATIKANEGLIYKVAHVYAQDGEHLKDLYQEIVYQLWKSFGSFKGQSKVSTWMYRVALNTCISYARKKTVHSVNIDFSQLNIVDEIDTETEARLQQMYVQIKSLSIVEKGIILLYLEGKSHEEIALITGFSVTNIGTRIARIKQKLKNKIKS